MIEVDLVGQYFVGAPGLVWKQAYNPLTPYVKNDAVSYNGSSYVALQSVLGTSPTGIPSDTLWATLAAKGADGSGGSGSVSSVNGHVGVVLLAASDVGAATSSQGVKADTAVQPSGMTKAAVGLSDVDNTSDVSKPISTLTQTALDAKVDKVSGKVLSTNDYTTVEQSKLASIASGAQVNSVTSVSTRVGDIILTRGDVGLSSVDNTADINKPISTVQQTTFDTKVDKILGKQLSTNDYTTTEQTKLAGIAAGAQVNAVNSVAGRAGIVTLSSADVGLGNVTNTSDTAKPVSTAQQSALDLKANLASPTFTGTVGGITATMVGLGSVNNTSDASKPISTATQTALNLLAPIASPTFTGTVSGITKTMVGLSNSDSLPEGSTNQYFTNSRVLTAVMTGLSTASSAVAAATDSVLVGIGKLQAQVSLKLSTIAAFTNTTTSGTNASATIDVATTPTSSSTQVVIGQRTSINYSSSNNMTAGGYLLPGQDVISTSGTGTHDKLVGRYSQMNLTGGNITSAISFEAAPATIGATTLIGSYAGYYFPNLAGVANISNISTFACFSNDEPRAFHRSAGPYLNADLREIAPSRSAGLVSGRYYTSPCGAVTTNIVATNVIYVDYVYIPRRCTPTALGCNVTTAAAGNVILGMYKVQDNQVTTLIAQTSPISTSTTGLKEGTVAVQVDSGVYAIVATFSGTPTITWHAINTNDMIGASSATGYSEQAYISPFTFGTLPSTANILPTFAANTIEPHLWFRV